jgi:decaprenylphospho-beta-D-ribofuranose 2-oxidase
MATPRTILAGWGRTTATTATVHQPASGAAAVGLLAGAGPRGILARGLGRSYGDAAQNAGGEVADMVCLDGILAFDAASGRVTVGPASALTGCCGPPSRPAGSWPRRRGPGS